MSKEQIHQQSRKAYEANELRLKVQKLEAENEKLKSDIRQMIEKAASKHLTAYREQGEKMLQLEQENERLREYLRLISMNQFDDVLIDSWCREALRGEEE